MKRIGLLLVGHGSRLEYNKELITKTADQMQEQKPEYIIKSCFMEFSHPTVTEGLTAMKSEDIDLLVVVPLFLAKGMHILRDIPRLLNLEQGKKQGTLQLDNGRIIPLNYAEPIGIDPLLSELMLKNAQAAIDMSDKMRILVLDTIHGGSVLAEALIRKGYDVDALDVYRGGFVSADEVRARKYDIITAPVHLDSDYPLLHIQEVISHHEMTAKLCGSLSLPLIEITGSRGKTTTAFAISHVMGKNGIIHTSRGTFHDDTLLFKKSITPASLLFAVTSAEKQNADWIVAEESLGVAGCGCLGILTSIEDYPICSGKRSALSAKLASLKRCSKVLVPAGIEKEPGWICVDDLVSVEGDCIKYADGSFMNSLVRIPVYQNALKFAAATALLLGKDPSVLTRFHAVEGRMYLYEEDGVPVLDNANSGVNSNVTKEAGTYLKSVTGKDIFLVIGEEKHAVCEGFSHQSIDDVISFLQPKEVFLVSENHLFEEAKSEAIEKAKECGGCVLLAVKGWR